LANRVFELDNGELRIFDSSFEEYLEIKENAHPQATAAMEDKATEKRRRQEEHQKRQSAQKALRRLKDEQARLETEIGTTEEQIARLEETLSDPANYGDHTSLAALGVELENAKSGLHNLLQQWEEITHQIEFQDRE